MSDDLRWFARHRMQWIAEMIDVYGFIRRDHLMRKFDISTPQASVDLRDFQRLYPGKIKYDKSAKSYVSALRRI